MKFNFLIGLTWFLTLNISYSGVPVKKNDKKMGVAADKTIKSKDVVLVPTEKKTEREVLEKIVFAGGCFWCMEPPFDKLPGVVKTISGYCGGKEKNPSYKLVSSGKTEHAEVIEVTFNPKLVSYDKLFETFWENIDPFAVDRQFCDGGSQYRSAIFYSSAKQKIRAKNEIKKIEKKLGRKVATKAEYFDVFWPAEDYHQDYYRKNPIRYKYYRYSCGRDKRLKEIWGK